MRRNGHNRIITGSRFVRGLAFYPGILQGERPRYCSQCTGCLRVLAECICGRGKLHRCVGCGNKLWNNEGRKVWWGKETRELCKACAALVSPTRLVDGAKYVEHARPCEPLDTAAKLLASASLEQTRPRFKSETPPTQCWRGGIGNNR